MRYMVRPNLNTTYSSSDLNLIRRASLGPAAIAARVAQDAQVNLGIPQRRFIGNPMTRGGSMGALGHHHRGRAANPRMGLGCCGLGSLGSSVPPVTVIGPIAARIISLRKSGVTPQVALLDALAMLNSQGVKTLTQAQHLQLAAGLQPLPSGLAGFLGALGLSSGGQAAITGATVGGSTLAVGAASALGLGAGIALGQTVIPIPVVGAVIGAIVFEAAHLLQRHVGHAEASWTAPGFYASLRNTQGRDYDEYQYSEAFKGMMDTNGDIFPGCGADRHKDPDCFMGPLANTIAQGYLTGKVPLTATTAQVYATVVIPWMAARAGGLMNWVPNISNGPSRPQWLMVQAATDRYLAGEAMTRGDMPSYNNVGAHTPTLVQALQPILAQPTTTTPQTAPISQGTSSAGGPVYQTPPVPMVNVQDPTAGGAPPIVPGIPSSNYPIAAGGSGSPPVYSYPPPTDSTLPAIGQPLVTPPDAAMPPLTAQSGLFGISWPVLALGAAAVYFLTRGNSSPAAPAASSEV